MISLMQYIKMGFQPFKALFTAPVLVYFYCGAGCFLQVKIPQFCKDFSLSTGGEIFTCKKHLF